jgi:hypothetical protein
MSRLYVRWCLLSLIWMATPGALGALYEDAGTVKNVLRSQAPEKAGYVLYSLSQRYPRPTLLQGCLETIHDDDYPESAKLTAAKIYVFIETAGPLWEDLFDLMLHYNPYISEAALDVFRVRIQPKHEQHARLYRAWQKQEDTAKEKIIRGLLNSTNEDPSSSRSIAKTAFLIRDLHNFYHFLFPILEDYLEQSRPHTTAESVAAKTLTEISCRQSTRRFLTIVRDLRAYRRPVFDIYLAESLRKLLRDGFLGWVDIDNELLRDITPEEIRCLIKLLLDSSDRRSLRDGVFATSIMISRIGMTRKDLVIPVLQEFLREVHDSRAAEESAQLSLNILEGRTPRYLCFVPLFFRGLKLEQKP